MRYLLEKKEYYKIGDKIVLEYWYNDMIVVAKIINIIGRKYLISHKIDDSKIFNAPDEFIKSSDILSKFK